MDKTFNEVVDKCKRKNEKENNNLHWFASKFSIYFSYFFLRLRLTADQVTIIFFLVGLIGAISYGFNNIILTIVGYLLFRLHIIIDMSDGDVARFHQSFSIRGSYWDSVIHSILNPLYYIFITSSFFLQFNNEYFLYICPFIGLSSSVLMGVKNNYYKAMLFNNKNLKKNENNYSRKNKRFKLFFFMSEIMSIEGFIFLTVLVRYFGSELFAFIIVYMYLSSNLLIALIKFFQFSYLGKAYSKV